MIILVLHGKPKVGLYLLPKSIVHTSLSLLSHIIRLFLAHSSCMTGIHMHYSISLYSLYIYIFDSPHVPHE